MESKPSPANGVITNKSEHENRINEKLRRELGPLVCQLLEDKRVIEVMLNPDGCLWVERLGEEMHIVGDMSASQAESLMGTIASILKTQITTNHPSLECELPLDGSRFAGAIPPIVQAPSFSIRKKASEVFTLENYVASGVMTDSQCEAIKKAVLERENILVVGGTGTGKTTLTNAIINNIAEVCPQHRIVIIEDTLELQCKAKNVVPMRSVAHVDMSALLKLTLRFRPDRILVGEVRDGNALALLNAWNTGHPGGVATLHSNSAPAGLIRLERLVAEATQAPVSALIAEAVDLIVSIKKVGNELRRVNEVVRVKGHDGINYLTQPI